MKKIFLLFLCVFIFTTSMWSQKYSNEFLSIGVGGQASGMGQAVTSSTADAFSAYWNPAGLAEIKGEGLLLGAMHNEWFAGIGKYDYLSMVIPSSQKNRTIGLALIRFGIDNIPNTLSLYDDAGNVNYDNVSSFSAADYAVLFSYASTKKIKNNSLSYGGNVKIVRRVIGTFASSWGFGIDLGAKYHVGKFDFGFMAKDITTTFNIWNFDFTEEEKAVLVDANGEVPIKSTELTKPGFNLGVAYKKQWNKIGLLSEVDFQLTTDGKRNTLVKSNTLSLSPVIGFEIDYLQKVYLRTGVNNIQEETDFDTKKWTAQPNIGVGLKFNRFQLDYAYTDLGSSENASYSHVISLMFQLQPKKK